MESIEADLIIEGQVFKIYLLKRGRRCWGKDFLERLQPAEQKGIFQLLLRAADSGLPPNPERHKYLRDGIHEFKYGQIRLLFFRIEQALYITNGFRKKKDKTPEQEIKRAIRLMNDFKEAQHG